MPRRPDPWQELVMAAHAAGQPDQPMATFLALDSALAAAIGHKLFTAMVLNWDRGENQRVYTNNAAAYPVGGSKPMAAPEPGAPPGLLQGSCRINHDYAELSAAFFDHEQIRALGCESSINVPVRWKGHTIGLLNLLHESGWYSEADVPTLTVFATLAVPAMLSIIQSWPAAGSGNS